MTVNKPACVPRLAAVALAALAALAGGCGRGKHKGNPVLASYRNGEIRAEDVRSQLAAMPEPLRRKYESPEGRKQLLDRLVDERLLEAEAQRQGLDRHPAVARARRQQMIALLVQGQAASQPAAGQREEDARRYYQQHYAEFHQQPQLTIVDLTVRDRGQLATLQAELARARRAVQGGAPAATWTALVDRWIRGGRVSPREVGPFGEHVPGAVPLALAAAARNLRDPHELSDPVEIAGTVHVVQLKQRQAGRAAPFTDVRHQIVQRLAQQDEQARTQRLTGELRGREQVQIDAPALQALDLQR